MTKPTPEERQRLHEQREAAHAKLQATIDRVDRELAERRERANRSLFRRIFGGRRAA
jgi:hypothetical protein